MSDIFSQSHATQRTKAIRDQSAAHEKALSEEAKRRVAAREAERKASPNRDVGYAWRPKFFAPNA